MIAIAAVVAKQISRPVVGGYQDVQVAVAVEIRISGAPRDDRPIECRAHFRRDIGKFTVSQITKKQRWFAIADLGLYASDLLFNMTVGGEDIRTAVQIVIEKEDAEGERQQAGSPDGR